MYYFSELFRASSASAIVVFISASAGVVFGIYFSLNSEKGLRRAYAFIVFYERVYRHSTVTHAGRYFH